MEKLKSQLGNKELQATSGQVVETVATQKGGET